MPIQMLLGGWAAKKGLQYGSVKLTEHVVKEEAKELGRKSSRKAKEALAKIAGVELPQEAPRKTLVEKTTDKALGRLTGLVKTLEQVGGVTIDVPELPKQPAEPTFAELAKLSRDRVTTEAMGKLGSLQTSAEAFVKTLEEKGQSLPTQDMQSPAIQSKKPDQMM